MGTRFSSVLKEMLNAKGITQKSLALSMSCSPATVSQLLAGTRLPASPDKFMSLLSSLGFDLNRPEDAQKVSELCRAYDDDRTESEKGIENQPHSTAVFVTAVSIRGVIAGLNSEVVALKSENALLRRKLAEIGSAKT